MHIIDISASSLKKLKKYELDSGLYNSEGNLYILKEKQKWIKELKMLKLFFCNTGANFSNKLFTINELINNRSIIGIEEMVFPEKLLVMDEKVSGFVMTYIDSVNFETILKDNNIDSSTKINYFKQIASILEKMDAVRKTTVIDDFYLNDLHAGNFILNKKTNNINVVDLDSCKINGNKAFPAKYLTSFSIANHMPYKYKQNDDKRYPGNIIANKNSDLYCYIVMFLNFLYKDNILSLDRENYYIYLEYLRSINYPYELLDKLFKIYEPCDNEEIVSCLDQLDFKMISMAQKNVFRYKIKSKF